MRKVLLNGLYIGSQPSGVHYYGRHLLQGMNGVLEGSDIDIEFLWSASKMVTHHRGGRVREIAMPFFYNSRISRVMFEHIGMNRLLHSRNVSLYHSLNYVLPATIAVPAILTVHDLISEDYPEFCQRETVIYHNLLQRRSIAKADKIIAVSEYVRHQILQRMNVPADKVEVIPNAVRDIFFAYRNAETRQRVAHKYRLTEDFILFVGNIEPKKNISRLIRAFHLLKATKKIPHKLVIVGRNGWRSSDVLDTVQKLGISNEVKFCGYVSDDELPYFYELAKLFILPSITEGFGIPVLEAMAVGTPTVVSDIPALREVADGILKFFDPYSIDEMAAKILYGLHDQSYRNKVMLLGAKWASAYSVQSASMKTIDLYRSVLADKL